MKCSNPHCNRGIGLVAHRRGWFDKRRYCSKECRNTFVAQRPKISQQERSVMTYVEWLFLQPVGTHGRSLDLLSAGRFATQLDPMHAAT
jgi:hypothetical protein